MLQTQTPMIDHNEVVFLSEKHLNICVLSCLYYDTPK